MIAQTGHIHLNFNLPMLQNVSVCQL